MSQYTFACSDQGQGRKFTPDTVYIYIYVHECVDIFKLTLCIRWLLCKSGKNSWNNLFDFINYNKMYNGQEFSLLCVYGNI